MEAHTVPGEMEKDTTDQRTSTRARSDRSTTNAQPNTPRSRTLNADLGNANGLEGPRTDQPPDMCNITISRVITIAYKTRVTQGNSMLRRWDIS